MAFSVLQWRENGAIEMLQLLAFLSPEAVPTDFLLARMQGRNNGGKISVKRHCRLALALLDLEKFSLVKWDQIHATISVHRIVQELVRKQMAPVWTQRQAIKLSALLFPAMPTRESRLFTQKHHCQALELSLHHPLVLSPGYADLQHRLGKFLCKEGKCQDGERLLQKSTKIFIELSHFLKAIEAKRDLAEVYTVQGRINEAQCLHTEIVELIEELKESRGPEGLDSICNLPSTVLNCIALCVVM